MIPFSPSARMGLTRSCRVGSCISHDDEIGVGQGGVVVEDGELDGGDAADPVGVEESAPVVVL